MIMYVSHQTLLHDNSYCIVMCVPESYYPLYIGLLLLLLLLFLFLFLFFYLLYIIEKKTII